MESSVSPPVSQSPSSLQFHEHNLGNCGIDSFPQWSYETKERKVWPNKTAGKRYTDIKLGYRNTRCFDQPLWPSRGYRNLMWWKKACLGDPHKRGKGPGTHGQGLNTIPWKYMRQKRTLFYQSTESAVLLWIDNLHSYKLTNWPTKNSFLLSCNERARQHIKKTEIIARRRNSLIWDCTPFNQLFQEYTLPFA